MVIVMNPNQNTIKKRNYGGWIFLVIMVVVAITILLNRYWIYDWYLGLGYAPTSEMVKIRDELNLTDSGKFLFNATRPELNEAEEFNRNCRWNEIGENETAVLGCYADGNVYVYNVTAKELDGILELTTAHELLHAKWARMSESQKRELDSALTKVFEENKEILESEIETYNASDRQEELYVRAGTEVKKLPENLEKHFAEVFKNQDLVVDFYDSYIAVFRETEEKMEKLMGEMETLEKEINDKTAEYERQANQLDADILSFNNCADTIGCFNSESEFYAARGRLVGRQNELDGLN